MEVDLSRFYGAFFEEAEEHIGNLEGLLLGLDLEAPDPEHLNAIFRAAHSIKGGAGTFGFTDIAALTHFLENLLDRIRKGLTRLNPSMVDLFLRTGDVLAGMIAVHRDGASQDLAAVEQVATELKQLEEREVRDGPPIPGYAEEASASGEVDSEGGVQRWHLNLRLESTTELDPLLAALEALGRVVELSREERGGYLHTMLEIESVESLQDMSESLAFVLPSDRFEFTAPPEDEPEVEASALDADATPEAVKPMAGEGEAFGFFDDVPSAPSETSVASEPTATVPLGAGEGDIRPKPAQSSEYGFFEPLPEVSAEAPAGREGIAYGLFDTTSAAPGVKASTDVEKAPTAVAGKAAGKTTADKGEAATIRVDVTKVDQLLNLVGELVITQSMLAQSAAVLDPIMHSRLLSGVELLQRNTRELQESVMSIRMIPMSTVFSRFPRVVRDLAAKLGKKVELRLVGEQTELDKGFVEKLVDPLTHLVRNSLDHGIESMETRRQLGKPESGLLTLCAFHRGGNVVIEVRDDGAGLNRERILAKARDQGLSISETMTDEEVWQLIFEAGFSTAAEITDVSGRGVGMDVVRKNIIGMGGHVDIESMAGVGSTMRIHLPLTLAILDGMLIAVGGETYILPLNAIVESLQPTPEQCRTVTGKGRVVQVRDEYLPLVALHEVVGCKPLSSEPSHGIVVLVESGNQHIALWVDELLGQQQVVVKNLESNYRRVLGMSGATILGDGRVALIVDVTALAKVRTAA